VPQFINRQVTSASLLFVHKQFVTWASRILEKWQSTFVVLARKEKGKSINRALF